MINIAIVDDHQILINGLKNIFEKQTDFKVVFTANNGVETLENKHLNEVDIFIIDIEMPDMDGIELSKKIRSQCSKAKILILSMYNDSLLVKKIKEFGINGFLPKNIDEHKILKAIREIINGNNFFESTYNLNQAKIKTKIDNLNTIEQLSNRELEVLFLIAKGYTNNKIAECLFLSPNTIDSHRTNIMKKLDVTNVVLLVRKAIKLGLIN